jgi:hypothetical protein
MGYTVILFAVGCLWLHRSLALSARELRALESTIKPSPSTETPSSENFVFNGKIVTTCEFEECFSAVVAGGRTNWQSTGANSDLANIYTPENDYDKWIQLVSSDSRTTTYGEFVYQMANSSLSCLTIMLHWEFTPIVVPVENSPIYDCYAAPLAMNWDCHLDWGLTVDCTFNTTSKSIEAVFGITNMGPEAVEGEPAVVVVTQTNEHKPVVSRVKKFAKHM